MINKKIVVSLSLIAVLLFDLIPLVFAAGGTHILRELPPTVVYVDNTGYIKQKTTSAGVDPSNSPGAVPYYAATAYYASTASSATTASTAAQANYATSAGSATSTTYASTSYFASTATHANTADTASSANYASSATVASSVNTGSGISISGNSMTWNGVTKSGWQTFSTPNLHDVVVVGADTGGLPITTGGLTANGAATINGAGSLNVDLSVKGRIRTGDGNGNGGVWLTSDDSGFVGSYGGNIGFWTNGAGWNALQIVKSSGNVGIGKTDPGAKLDVNGDIRGLNNFNFYHNNAGWTAMRDDGGGILHIAPWANQYSEVRIGTLGNTKLTATGGFYPSIKETIIPLGDQIYEADSTTYVFKGAGEFYYDSSRYLGDVKVYYEVIAAQQCGARNGGTRLKRADNGAVVPGSEIIPSNTAPSYIRYRAGPLSLSTGDYYVESKASSDTCDLMIPVGRIIIQVD